MSDCILIAHPDDESMFFLPTIICNSKTACICCITHSQGKRRSELEKVGQFLGVKVYFLEENEFEDSMQANWNTEKLGVYLKEFIIAQNINRIFTFDSQGVSGHINHCQLSIVASHLKMKNVSVFHLKTHSIIWKYCILSKWFPYSVKSTTNSLIFQLNVLEALRLSFACMKLHASQFVWFRVLYLIFTCYTCINEYQQLRH